MILKIYKFLVEKKLQYELRRLEFAPYWICAWWTPDYEAKRRKELMNNFFSKKEGKIK